MKVPKYMYQPLAPVHRCALDMARKALEIEATLYRNGGQQEAARALRNSATMLKRLTKGTSPSFADAFDFPFPSSAEAPR